MVRHFGSLSQDAVLGLQILDVAGQLFVCSGGQENEQILDRIGNRPRIRKSVCITKMASFLYTGGGLCYRGAAVQSRRTAAPQNVATQLALRTVTVPRRLNAFGPHSRAFCSKTVLSREGRYGKCRAIF